MLCQISFTMLLHRTTKMLMYMTIMIFGAESRCFIRNEKYAFVQIDGNARTQSSSNAFVQDDNDALVWDVYGALVKNADHVFAQIVQNALVHISSKYMKTDDDAFVQNIDDVLFAEGDRRCDQV